MSWCPGELVSINADGFIKEIEKGVQLFIGIRLSV